MEVERRRKPAKYCYPTLGNVFLPPFFYVFTEIVSLTAALYRINNNNQWPELFDSVTQLYKTVFPQGACSYGFSSSHSQRKQKKNEKNEKRN